MRRRATSGEMARGGFWFGGFFCGWTGSGCGSMCWPVDRPATHAAAGAAARGALIFLFWGILSHARERLHEGVSSGLRAASGEDGTRGFWFGGLFHTLGSGGTRGFDFLFWGALLLFVLRVVAGACVGRRTGQPRMPPRERQHEGLGG